jgi:hypothetical protein
VTPQGSPIVQPVAESKSNETLVSGYFQVYQMKWHQKLAATYLSPTLFPEWIRNIIFEE